MKNTKLKTLLAAAATIGLMNFASADTLLQPGYAVHTFGASPDADNGDGNATVRIYKISDHDYAPKRPTAEFKNEGLDATVYSHHDWNIDKIGNVYGIAIDKDRNIYVSASANYSPGYVGTGDSNKSNVTVKYGSGGAGSIYKIDASSGDVTTLVNLQKNPSDTITNEVCQGNGDSVTRGDTGPGLGNVAYDKVHNQLFASNFKDGSIERIDMNGKVLQEYSNTGLSGLDDQGKIVESPYGLVVSPDGTKLYYGTMETNKNPRLYSVVISKTGELAGKPKNQLAKLGVNLTYTQNVGGDVSTIDDYDAWLAYSDLSFTPDNELLVGVRMGCKGNFATSYNHGGVVYLLAQNEKGLYNQPSKKVPGQNNTVNGADNKKLRAGYSGDDLSNPSNDKSDYNYDAGAVPLHPHTSGDIKQETQAYGPDDGYGGVAVWQYGAKKFDVFATSSDITSGEGVHGFMQFSGDINISQYGTIANARAYKSVKSSQTDIPTNDNQQYDYKGIGGDVEVLSVVPMCIGSYVWEDTDKKGDQDTDEPGICGAKVHLISAETNQSVVDIDGNLVEDVNTSCESGKEGTYKFCNLPEGKYKVCVVDTPKDKKFVYTKTPKNTSMDDNDSLLDSNFADGNCSAVYSLWANTEPVENANAKGDDLDDANDKLGNMSVDFGFVKRVFDLAIKKTLADGFDPDTKYHTGDDINFTITVINQGNVDATNVVVVDDIPDGLVLRDSSWQESGDNHTARYTIQSLKANSSKDINIAFKVGNVDQNKTIINYAEIGSAQNQFDLNDTDSTPGDGQCKQDDQDNKPDYGSDGCDDIDPALIKIVKTVKPDPVVKGVNRNNAASGTSQVNNQNDTNSSVPCNCGVSDKVDAMGTLGLIVMLLATLLLAVRFVPKDETAI